MHPFPLASQLNFVLGHELSRIVVARYMATFSSSTGLIIRLEKKFEFMDRDGKVCVCDPQHETNWDLPAAHSLIGDSIVKLKRDDYRLALTFKSNRQLIVLSDDSAYECGQIAIGSTDTLAPMEGFIF